MCEEIYAILKVFESKAFAFLSNEEISALIKKLNEKIAEL